jgi:hypothetical protein
MTMTYSYDAIGQRDGMVASGIGRFTYAYDSSGMMDHLVNPQGDRTSLSIVMAGSGSGRTVARRSF